MKPLISAVSILFLLSIIFTQGCEKENLDGLNSLVKIEDEPGGENCISGGVKISSGLDMNSNNILDDNEITYTNYVCNGSDGMFDKQVIIPFIGPNHPSTSLVTGSVSTTKQLKDFNILNYPGADSIIFGGFPESTESTIKCTVELYDNTNKKIINNTKITSNATTLIWQTTSTNFIDDLPRESIDLLVFIRSGKGGTDVHMYDPTLIIYRH